VIDSNVTSEFYSPVLNNDTYTLEDLLDFGNENVNTLSILGESLDDDILLEPSNQILMETAMASPLSSSSEESCDINELFMDDDTLTSFAAPFNSETEVSNDTSVPNDTSVSFEFQTEIQSPIQSPVAVIETPQPSLESMLASAGTDLSALCTLLLQNQAVGSPQSDSSFDDELSEVHSPSSFESETESVRYKPYKKVKTKEQKLRKKAQNRTAATRYRVKKKDEMKIMSEEADKLEEKNKALKGKVDGLRTEIDYLKNLMLDVIKARLVKGEQPQNLLSAVTVN